MIKEQNIQRLEDNEVLKINKQVGFLQKRNPICGAVIVEKLEYIIFPNFRKKMRYDIS